VLERAQELNARGKAAEAISILEPLIRSPGGLDDDQRGVAWSVLGYSHQSMGQYEEAQQCYETAIRLLKAVPAAEERYAAALENLASIEGLMHRPDAATILNLMAKTLYQLHRDYDGMTRVDAWLAGIAVARNKMRRARSRLRAALSESQQAPNHDYGIWVGHICGRGQPSCAQSGLFASGGSLSAVYRLLDKGSSMGVRRRGMGTRFTRRRQSRDR
jgi:tetratricopeptide (TPR) repeat protein